MRNAVFFLACVMLRGQLTKLQKVAGVGDSKGNVRIGSPLMRTTSTLLVSFVEEVKNVTEDFKITIVWSKDVIN